MTPRALNTTIPSTATVNKSWLLDCSRVRAWTTVAVSVGLLIATWATYAGGGSQTVFPHLFYVPIIVAAFVFRCRGGLLIGLVSGLLCGPFMPLSVSTGMPQPALNWITTTIIFAAVGILSGTVIEILFRRATELATLQEQSARQEKDLKALNEQLQSELAERRRAEEQARRAAARATVLARVTARLNAHLELDAVLNAVCEEAADALSVPAASVSLYDERGERLTHAASVGLPPAYPASVWQMPRAHFDERTSPMEPLRIVRDVQAIAGYPNAHLYTRQNIRTIVTVGLVREQQLLGTLSIFTVGQPRSFSDEELAVLTQLADQATQAITNARLAAQASRRSRHLSALRAIDSAITASLDLRVTLNIFLDQVITHLGVDAADVLLLNPHTQVLEYAAGRGTRSAALQNTRLRLGQGYASRAALERRLVSIPNLLAAAGDFARAPLLAAEGFVAYHGAPLIAKGQVKGVLEIFHRAPLDPDPEWLDFLQALAAQAAIAIENAVLFEDLQRSNTQLALAYDATIEGWSRALDLRDRETEGHTQRVAEMTLRLARAMGMSAAELVHVRRGALLHDIGKMGIPDSILLKVGPLSDAEWEIMRRHPVYAYDLLTPIAFLRPALEIPYCHHEKWDGTGYPRGLKGEQIPLAARIFAVVDVWDALRSDRPYRRAWAEEQVREHIRSLAGSHFDPRVVPIFLEMMAERDEARAWA